MIVTTEGKSRLRDDKTFTSTFAVDHPRGMVHNPGRRKILPFPTLNTPSIVTINSYRDNQAALQIVPAGLKIVTTEGKSRVGDDKTFTSTCAVNHPRGMVQNPGGRNILLCPTHNTPSIVTINTCTNDQKDNTKCD